MTPAVQSEIDLLLLSIDGHIQRLQQIFGKIDPGFEFSKTMFQV